MNFFAWISLMIPWPIRAASAALQVPKHRAAGFVAGTADPDLAYSFPQSKPHPNHPAGHQEQTEEHHAKKSPV